jgi:hypothetical protein
MQTREGGWAIMSAYLAGWVLIGTVLLVWLMGFGWPAGNLLARLLGAR